VRDEGARVAGHLLTMAIRALDYCPPTDLTFSDYLSALLTIDREVVPDDDKYGYRKSLLKNFNDYGIQQAGETDVDGTWKRCDEELIYSRSHYGSMLREPQEVFRFIWENRNALKIDKDSYIEVQSVRVGPDGFVLNETVAEYIQILTCRGPWATNTQADRQDQEAALARSRRVLAFSGQRHGIGRTCG
jgi:hypothetical protein